MTRGGYAASVQRVAQALPGVQSMDVSLECGETLVRHEASATIRTQIAQPIDIAGFDAA